MATSSLAVVVEPCAASSSFALLHNDCAHTSSAVPNEELAAVAAAVTSMVLCCSSANSAADTSVTVAAAAVFSSAVVDVAARTNCADSIAVACTSAAVACPPWLGLEPGLDTLMEKIEVPKEFDVLVVDVEGKEAEVFKTFELDEWKPKMLIVELEDGHHSFQKYEGLIKEIKGLREYIKSKGYVEVFRDYINTVFVREELKK